MFSDNLKKLLKEKGMSQSELAAELNTHRQNVYQWVAGRTTPRNKTLVKLASILGVSVNSLLEDTSIQSPSVPKAKTDRNILQKSSTKPTVKLSLRTILSSNIKYYRRLADLTQAELAQKADSDPVYISYIENGQRFPSVDFIEKIAEIMNIENFRLFLPRNSNTVETDTICQNLKTEMLKTIDKVFSL